MRKSLLFLLISGLLSLVCAIAGAQSPATSATTSPTTSPTSAPASITWDQAKDYVGKPVIVTGPVVGSHDLGGAVVLNVGKDFPDKTRFTVYVTAENRKALPDDLYQGKTIAVTGKLKLFHRVAEIEADAAHIIIADSGPATTPATQP
jgi:hypothetical protein